LIKEKFIGTVTQIPPNLSAIKIGGQKACDMARKGIMLEMKPRDIQIYENEILLENLYHVINF